MKVSLMKAKHFAHEWPYSYFEAVQERRMTKPHTVFNCEKGCDKCATVEGGPCSVEAWRRNNDKSSA